MLFKKACHFNNSQSDFINLPVFALFELYLAYLPQEPTNIINQNSSKSSFMVHTFVT